MRYYYRPFSLHADEHGFVEEKYSNEGPNPEMAKHAPILMDRFYENTAATDGEDIGSRRKHREYMKRNNVTSTSDYTLEWANAANEREKIRKGENDRQERREQIGRAMYERFKP